MAERSVPKLRFAVHDRVEVWYDRRWRPGIVITLSPDGEIYTEKGKPPNPERWAYSVELDEDSSATSVGVPYDKANRIIAERSASERLAQEIYEASDSGQSSTLKKLLRRSTEEDYRSAALEWAHPHHKQTALFAAIQCEHLVVVRMLIEANAAVDTVRPSDGSTALLLACKQADAPKPTRNALNVVKMLLSSKADPAQSPAGGGLSALSSPWRHQDIADLLSQRAGQAAGAAAAGAVARSDQETLTMVAGRGFDLDGSRFRDRDKRSGPEARSAAFAELSKSWSLPSSLSEQQRAASVSTHMVLVIDNSRSMAMSDGARRRLLPRPCPHVSRRLDPAPMSLAGSTLPHVSRRLILPAPSQSLAQAGGP